jgi:hypothetical protein
MAAVWLGGGVTASAVPPPPARPDVGLDLRIGGPELVARDAVCAHQSLGVVFSARAGDRLRLVDDRLVLVLGMQAPSGRAWMSGARPRPDALELRLAEDRPHRLRVQISADATLAGRSGKGLRPQFKYMPR